MKRYTALAGIGLAVSLLGTFLVTMARPPGDRAVDTRRRNVLIPVPLREAMLASQSVGGVSQDAVRIVAERPAAGSFEDLERLELMVSEWEPSQADLAALRREHTDAFGDRQGNSVTTALIKLARLKRIRHELRSLGGDVPSTPQN